MFSIVVPSDILLCGLMFLQMTWRGCAQYQKRKLNTSYIDDRWHCFKHFMITAISLMSIKKTYLFQVYLCLTFYIYIEEYKLFLVWIYCLLQM